MNAKGTIKKMRLEGIAQAKKAFAARLKEATRAVAIGVRDGSNLVRDAARQTSTFEDQSGRLRKSINTRKERTRPGVSFYKVGPDRRKGGFHGHLVEKGHKLVAHGRTLGRVAGRPFMQSAFQLRKSDAEQRVRDAIRRAMK